MKLEEWCQIVRQTLASNPEWMTATNEAITAGVKDRLDEEVTARARAEASLVVCLDAAGGAKRLPEHHRQMVLTAIKQSKLVGGTEYANICGAETRGRDTGEIIVDALKLAQNQIAASRDMCNEYEVLLWDTYQQAIDAANGKDEL